MVIRAVETYNEFKDVMVNGVGNGLNIMLSVNRKFFVYYNITTINGGNDLIASYIDFDKPEDIDSVKDDIFTMSDGIRVNNCINRLYDYRRFGKLYYCYGNYIFRDLSDRCSSLLWFNRLYKFIGDKFLLPVDKFNGVDDIGNIVIIHRNKAFFDTLFELFFNIRDINNSMNVNNNMYYISYRCDKLVLYITERDFVEVKYVKNCYLDKSFYWKALSIKGDYGLSEDNSHDIRVIWKNDLFGLVDKYLSYSYLLDMDKLSEII